VTLLSRRVTLISRRLLRAPAFTFIAVLTLALGIGANAAIFTVVRGVLLKPLPFRDPDRLVSVSHLAPGLGIRNLEQSPATYLTYRDEARTFEEFGIWSTPTVSVTGVGDPERVDAIEVTDGTLRALGVPTIAGRLFTAADDTPQAPQRMLLTYPYWQRKFGGDPTIVGRQVMVDGIPREIIGVLPRSFIFLNEHPQLVLPMRLDPAKVFVGDFSYGGIARLKPGVTIEQANADIARLIPRVVERFPLVPGFSKQMYEETRMAPSIRPLAADVIGDVARILWVLLGTTGIVLLIACANVANLFLVRAEGRQQELAVHSALGATRAQVAWELFSETLGLALCGGAAGLLLATVGMKALVAMAPSGLPRLEEIGVDPIVVLFTGGLSLIAAVLFSVIPVLKLTTPQVAGALKEGGRLSSAGRSRHRARNVLATVEIALAVVLLVASGLMIRTFLALGRVNPGFTHPEQVLTMRVSIPSSLVPDPEATVRMHEQIQNRIAQIPGITSVGLASGITMDGSMSGDPIFAEDFPETSGRLPPIRRYKYVGSNYFETMGNPVIAGRTLTWADSYERRPVVVINESLARDYWKNPADAVGRRVRNSPKNPWRTVVGVVGDERDDGAAKPAPKTAYWPALIANYWIDDLRAQRTLAYAIRSSRPQSAMLIKEVQQAVWSVNPNLPVASVRTLNQIRSSSMAQTSFALVMLGIAAAVALLLGVIGIYGVISYVATQRTREIGIRMALGAAARDVSGLFLRQGSVIVAIGIAAGLAGAALATRVMSTLLFGVSAVDPLTYVAVTSVLAATALLASYVPARRAARLDPSVALRWEA
jgi:predicted permease